MERIHQFLDIIAKVKEIKYLDLQRIMGLGDGVFERIVKEALSYYDNEITFDKKSRVFRYISIPPEENTEQNILEKNKIE